MPAFVLLADPSTYRPSDWDLAVDPTGRAYWIDLFRTNFRTILKLAIDMDLARGAPMSVAQSQADKAAADFDAQLDAFAAHPDRFGMVGILTLDEWRDSTLRRHGYQDSFLDLKNRENTRMLPLLPLVCAQLDAIDDELERFSAAIGNVFAGNIFDMGATATAQAFLNHSPDFFATRRSLRPRPWLVDHYDALVDRILKHPRGPHRKCVFFIDNAGSDFLLGAIPLMRLLARRGTQIVLAANERPSLNDMTIHDVRAWWPQILAAEPSLAKLPIELVSTGTGEPLIDLSQVSADLNAAARDADLVILEGMGRGMESNFNVRLTTDTLNIAMLKDPAVAARIGGQTFDLVCRFVPAV
jgi:type II pantothenate kinase